MSEADWVRPHGQRLLVVRTIRRIISGDTGARDLLRNVATVPLPLGELDIDTAEDLQKAQKLYETVNRPGGS